MTVAASQSMSYQALTVSVSRAPAPEPARAARRAEALMTALDADKDGAVTADEFRSGAMSLLGRGARSGAEGVDTREKHEGRSVGRFERRLDRAFERVDANGDGAVDAAELTSALGAIGRGGRGRRESEAETPQGPTAAPDVRPTTDGAVTAVQISFVAVAIRRYTTVATAAAAPIPNGTGLELRPADPVARPPQDPPAIPLPVDPPATEETPVAVASPVPRPPSDSVASPVPRPPSDSVASPVPRPPSEPVASPVPRPGDTPPVLAL